MKLFLGLTFIFLTFSSVQADIWKKIFKVETVSTSNEDQFRYGFQIGYQDAMNGQTNYLPDKTPFVRGYFEGRKQAFQDLMIRSGYFNQNNVIIINDQKRNMYIPIEDQAYMYQKGGIVQ